MKSNPYTRTLATGFALFSMFFGAGNLIFPLLVGQMAQDKAPYAIAGLLITAVGVPFLGLVAMTLYNGDYRAFFDRIGKWPSRLLIGAILALVGPFGALPRCIAFSYGSLEPLFDIPFIAFSGFACALTFLLTYRKMKIVDLLGFVLTPLLIAGMAYMIIVGFQNPTPLPASDLIPIETFWRGVTEGYHTMDLLAGFFFASVIFMTLKANATSDDPKTILKQSFNASIIGISLLMLTYIGLSLVAAQHSPSLQHVNPENLLTSLAGVILGPHAALMSALIVSLACLTTVISISAISADYLNEELTQSKLGYGFSLFTVLAITFLVSLLKFTGIKMLLEPILVVTYPALIILCVINIAHRLFNFKPIKLPFGLACGASYIYSIL